MKCLLFGLAMLFFTPLLYSMEGYEYEPDSPASPSNERPFSPTQRARMRANLEDLLDKADKNTADHDTSLSKCETYVNLFNNLAGAIPSIQKSDMENKNKLTDYMAQSLDHLSFLILTILRDRAAVEAMRQLKNELFTNRQPNRSNRIFEAENVVEILLKKM